MNFTISEQEQKILLADARESIAAELEGRSPRYNEYNLKQLLKEAQAIFPDTTLSRDRAVFPIEYED